ncbi:DsrE/DsrF-like family protein [Nocardioides dokdonensis FR1436]|uniref:DsrE/DsrF-like family protein n=1 Tax=Nocardioides dokdonensis FR1436 TaxID=1300347 RepID=A0A1A9GJA3_9ACTN|nr:DsrE family protein [Nocardioides dokdonensis]ANH38146.1 DsrE/DsrF-like family protein [Nocardioides dokdonensis FR1436]
MRPLVIKVTCAAGDPERSNQAFTVAAAATAAGADVSLWLTGDAAAYGAATGGPDLGLQHATPVAQLLEVVLAAGRVTVCTQCAARRGITEQDLAPGVRMAGAAVFAEEILGDDVQALVY